MVDGDRGRIIADDRHFSVSGVTGSVRDDPDSAPAIENTPATPLAAAAGAPRARRSLSCYGSGGRQAASEPVKGTAAGPLTLRGLSRARPGRVVAAPAILQPGGAVTLSVAPRDRDRAGLL